MGQKASNTGHYDSFVVLDIDNKEHLYQFPGKYRIDKRGTVESVVLSFRIPPGPGGVTHIATEVVWRRDQIKAFTVHIKGAPAKTPRAPTKLTAVK